MRLPSVRFTVRRMMAAVAVVGLVLGLPSLLFYETEQSLAWHRWAGDMEAKERSSRELAQRAHEAGNLKEEAKWRAKAEWFAAKHADFLRRWREHRRSCLDDLKSSGIDIRAILFEVGVVALGVAGLLALNRTAGSIPKKPPVDRDA